MITFKVISSNGTRVEIREYTLGIWGRREEWGVCVGGNNISFVTGKAVIFNRHI
jgi:hypothetical protein